jgi:site-specific DNA-methyltransferase (adenine-specific)
MLCNKTIHSSEYKTFNVHESTPDNLYKLLDEEFHFNFDPCPLNEVVELDGLKIDWKDSCFVNPPYGKAIKSWLEKGLLEIEKGNSKTVVFLLPSYTDVKWFHEIVIPKVTELRFIKGRLKFGKHKENAPFASMIVIFKEKAGVL